ncbi:MAG: amidohydrolase [Thermoflexaceae bacterium]|nr:amidohydrolase [Thermoflexaceae bacterium]
MHACGHDAHIAIALGLVEALAAKREKLSGSVRFVFQPAEEAAGGAQRCIEDGVLDSPKVDRALGLHISADIPIGMVNVAPGPFFAAPTAFKAVIEGRGGHAAAPHQSVDAIVVAAHAVVALQTVVSRSVAPPDAAVLTIGKLQSGFRGNVIAESATMTGTIRSYEDRVRELMLQRVEQILGGVCAAFGATYRFSHNTSCPPLVNDPGVAAFVVDQRHGCSVRRTSSRRRAWAPTTWPTSCARGRAVTSGWGRATRRRASRAAITTRDSRSTKTRCRWAWSWACG